MESFMAVDKSDVVTKELFSLDERIWIKYAVDAYLAQQRRARDKYPAESSAYKAIQSDMDYVMRIKEKLA